jgi:nitrile hydratase subunit beta
MSAHSQIATRFKVGARVHIADRSALGHCRTPWYLRGRIGEIVEIHGAYHDPERLAYHKPGLPLQVLYKVRFLQSDLWSGYHGPATDHLEADIYEYWLEPTP